MTQRVCTSCSNPALPGSLTCATCTHPAFTDEALRSLMEDPDAVPKAPVTVTEDVEKFHRYLFENYLAAFKAGFTKDQAMEVVNSLIQAVIRNRKK